MKIKHKAVLAALALPFISGVTMAEHFYAGANLSRMDFDSEATPTNLSINAGYIIGQGVSAELRLGNTIAADEVDDSDVELELNETVGVFVRAAVPDTQTITPYALVGYSSISLEIDVEGDDGERDNDIAYGFGVEYKVMNNVSVGVEWLDLYRKDDISLQAYSLTGRMGF